MRTPLLRVSWMPAPLEGPLLRAPSLEALSLAALLTLFLAAQNPLVGQEIDGPAFTVMKFLELEQPNGIDFDQAGNLFLGSGVNDEPVRLRFAPSDGSACVAVGELISDPDEVLEDKEGWLANPGHVIVAAGRHLLAVDPLDGSTTTLFSGPPIVNAAEMVFDELGRLFVGQVGADVLMVTPGSVSVIASFPGTWATAVTLDAKGRLYIGLRQNGEVWVLDTDPLGVPWLVATVPGWLMTIELGTRGAFAGDLFAGTQDGMIYRIEVVTGRVSPLLGGFSRANTIAFGPDGSMYVSDATADTIWVIPAWPRIEP